MTSKQSLTTKEQLFRAGIQVFAEKRYRDATVLEICTVAGSADIDSVNYYFKSEENLYREIRYVFRSGEIAFPGNRGPYGF